MKNVRPERRLLQRATRSRSRALAGFAGIRGNPLGMATAVAADGLGTS
jgi:hypothetical protein